jgi:hypothetical protein
MQLIQAGQKTYQSSIGLDDRELRDIGLTRLEAKDEASTPFWRD